MVIKADTQYKVLKVRFVPQLDPWAFRSRCGYPPYISANKRVIAISELAFVTAPQTRPEMLDNRLRLSQSLRWDPPES
jgi:hypothetical protein